LHEFQSGTDVNSDHFIYSQSSLTSGSEELFLKHGKYFFFL